ncbi:glycosyltransferase family 4 protein [Agaribacter flavus]|uniref:Glycosyltransferase family 4 protein n=1 Tax=Agaribacter flavus TaxID=1902781 RepID=A0ABV7FQD0_9ALTE
MTHQKTVIFIGYIWPEPNTTAAGQNILSYITSMQENQWLVHFWCAAEKSPHSIDLQNLGINVQQIKLNDDGFDELIEAVKPDVVIFDRYLSEEQFAWRVAKVCPNSLRVLDCEDLHFLRYGREVLFKQSENARLKHSKCSLNKQQLSKITYPLSRDIFADTALAHLHTPQFYRELASIIRCDLALTLSSFEADVLNQQYGLRQNIVHIPFIRERPTTRPFSFAERNNLITIGNLKHQPNVQAVEHLAVDIMPQVRKRIPSIQLHVYGEYAPPRIVQLHKPDKGVFIKGYSEHHIDDISRARLLLAPLQFGAGVKGKLLDAMACSTPSVTTALGAEGIDLAEWPGAIAADSDVLVQEIVRLYSEQSQWEHASSLSTTQDIQHFQPSINKQKFLQTIDEYLNNLDARRMQNYLQGMTMQQGLQASKYMSQWIIAKNKLKPEG